MTSRGPGSGQPVIDIAMQLRGTLAAAVQAEAKRAKRSPADLIADVIETVIKDDLFKAVLG